MKDLRDAVQSAVVNGGNSIAVSTGNSVAADAGNSSSAACKLAMSHNMHYDVTQYVTDYDAINVFGLKHKDLRGLTYQKRNIPGYSRQGMRLRVSHLAQLCPKQDAKQPQFASTLPALQTGAYVCCRQTQHFIRSHL
jgi:hypothetical protein